MGKIQVARGTFLCAIWYYTIVSGFYILYCPVIYLLVINHKLYRWLVDQLFALWELYPVALFQCCDEMHLHHYGDYVHPDEKAIIIMNHRTRVDWNYIWIALYHAIQISDTRKADGNVKRNTKCNKNTETVIENNVDNSTRDAIYRSLIETFGGKSKIKFVLKDEIKNIPALGWIMQMNYFLYIKRDWQEDQHSITKFLNYYLKMKSDFRLVLFPEGTDLSESNQRRSDRFAVSNNLPHYDFVLHPRTTGWAVLCSQLMDSGLTAIYDVTVAYDAPPQTETDLLRGHLPKHTHFFFKRYSAEQLPSDETSLRDWLTDRWREKECSLKNFHKNGVFLESTISAPIKRQPRPLTAAKIAFIFWNMIDIIFTYLLIQNCWFQFWVIYHSLLFIFVTWRFGGFHNVQYKFLENIH